MDYIKNGTPKKKHKSKDVSNGKQHKSYSNIIDVFTQEENYEDTIIDLGIVHGKYPNYIIIVILTKMLLEINLNYFHF